MGFPSKIVIIRGSKVNTIYCTVDNELDIESINFDEF